MVPICLHRPAEVRIPLRITTDQGDDVEVMECSTSILWPWDFFNTMYKNGSFLGWVSDDADPIPASSSVRNYWEHCSHLDFFKRLELPTNKLDTTIPLHFHADGVKIFKAQKAWVYSVSSASRKGGSLKTKLVIIIMRENRIIKEKSHDAVGRLMGYVTDTLMSGCFPMVGPDGSPFTAGSKEAERAGEEFAGGWTAAFAAFKGDWEARVIIHKDRKSVV